MSKTSMTRLRILVSGLPVEAANPVGKMVLRWLKDNVPEAGDALHQKLRWAAYHRVRVAVEGVLDGIRGELAMGLDDFVDGEEEDDGDRGVCGECGGPVTELEHQPFCSRACRESWEAKKAAFQREGQG